MNEQIHKCVLCDSIALIPPALLEANHDFYNYECRICGKVKIHRIHVINLRTSDKSFLHLVSGYTRERTEAGLEPIVLFPTTYEEFVEKISYPKSISEKLDRFLLYFERKSKFLGEPIDFHPYDRSIAYLKNMIEFSFLQDQLKARDWIENVIDSPGKFRLKVEGWNQLDEMRRSRKNSKQVFVATWFDAKMDEPYFLGIKRAIDDMQLTSVRMKELAHNDKIDDRIIAEIRKSKFVIADFTEHRAGVYFEAGFGMGLGIPIIWTCRKDYLDKAHFDTRQYNHIEWESSEDLYQKLKDRIEATIII